MSKIQEIIEKYQNLPLECDGMTRVLSYALNQKNILHKVCVGYAHPKGKNNRGILHYWIDLLNSTIVDISIKRWYQNTEGVLEGVFKPEDSIINYSKFDYITLETPEFLYKILTHER